MNRLFVVSNRVGPLGDDRKAGGLAVGIGDAFRKRGGVWFGWSGKTSEEGTFGPLQIKTEGNVQLATVDMTPADIEEFYSGFSNQTLVADIPLPHRPRQLRSPLRRTFLRINERIAGRLRPLLKPDDIVWVTTTISCRSARKFGRTASPARSASFCTSRFHRRKSCPRFPRHAPRRAHARL